MKPCPYCAEEIQDDAVKCRHCGRWLDETVPGPVEHPSSEGEDGRGDPGGEPSGGAPQPAAHRQPGTAHRGANRAAGPWRGAADTPLSSLQEQQPGIRKAARARRELRGRGGHPLSGAVRRRLQGSSIRDSGVGPGGVAIASVLRTFAVLAAIVGLGTAIAEWATARVCVQGFCYLNRSAVVAGFLLLFGGTLYAALLWGFAAGLSLLQQIARNTGPRAPRPPR